MSGGASPLRQVLAGRVSLSRGVGGALRIFIDEAEELTKRIEPLESGEDQDSLAGSELLDGSGSPDPASLDSGDPSVIRPGPSRGIALSWC